MNRPSIARYFIIAAMTATLVSSCRKHDELPPNKVTKHSSEVLDKWITLQLRLMRNATGIPNHAMSRQFAYSGITALEAIAPGLPSNARWTAKWNGLTNLPAPHTAYNCYYPANVNAAMAAINKAMFANAKQADMQAIDSLEAALNAEFAGKQSPEVLARSIEFGKAVAAAVYNWSESDGYKNNDPYTPPTGPGKWVPTPPSMLPAASPYWGNNRTVISGSIANTQPPPPVSYSTEPNSAFYQMAKQVYDVSQQLTDDQKAAAMFWRDVPGVSSPGHWLSILQQAMQKKPTRLDKAALAYALTGAAVHDAIISCWKTKYQYNLVRPITYIRNTMGHSNWNSAIGTPAHPEYASGHAVLSSAAADVLTALFGNSGTFTDHTYDYMGMAPRTYTSFSAIAKEAADSRLWGGIHYRTTLDLGLLQGSKVTRNILSAGDNYQLFSDNRNESSQKVD